MRMAKTTTALPPFLQLLTLLRPCSRLPLPLCSLKHFTVPSALPPFAPLPRDRIEGRISQQVSDVLAMNKDACDLSVGV